MGMYVFKGVMGNGEGKIKSILSASAKGKWPVSEEETLIPIPRVTVPATRDGFISNATRQPGVGGGR